MATDKARIFTTDIKKTVTTLIEELMGIPKGTPSSDYTPRCGTNTGAAEVYTAAIEKACGDPMLLGEITAASKCTTSLYGDKHFYFRLQPIEEDWALKPECWIRTGCPPPQLPRARATTA